MAKDIETLKMRLKNNQAVLGTWSSIASPALINVIGAGGLDFIIIDMEHGPAGMETAEDLVRAAEVAGMTPLIRVAANQADLILRALDIGARGIQVPHVSTGAEAQQVVEYAKYYPEGTRGLSPFTRAGGYGLDARGYTERANQETIVVVNLEGKKAIENIEEIASITGIDVIFIGPYDLSQSLGIPGEVTDSQVVEAIRHSAAVAKDHGIACGSFARDKAYLELLIECGVQYLTYMVDAAVIAQTYREIYNFFSGCRNRRVRV